ncbi:hypothetical protein CCACVL1_02552 [Corchorus capsularis]|uniref:Uncharacterized protein n=1 Tax=Corchorus capsularis TaxID=210143 RepID=A0A1R3K7P7_COCAP|nr:hypothetical protein CCACVL1_02552 [Corchorus capsularis]
MGTKLECVINPLASSSQNSNTSSSFTLHFMNDYFRPRALKENYCQKIELDRMLERHNMDSIRKTMQMHEDIFKHQVRELHRLYSVQRMLMDELKKEIKQNRYWTSPNSHEINQSQMINQHQLTAQTSSGYNFHVQVQGDPNPRERSGSCSGDTMRMAARGFDLETPADQDPDVSAEVSTAEDQAAAGPSSRINQMMMSNVQGSDEDSEVELTLSIGGSSSKKLTPNQESVSIHNSNRELDSSASFKSDRAGEDCSAPNTPISSSSTTFDQERKRPHWLFQGLSIKRT